ncbi:AroM protein [Biomaibacter acetigenes]|uniref:AroM protein n=1 Tax=Biomaibacter acetigenes TaxID=2316383 RepID=A0A3G2R2P4_9FIRM|nr:AroM family protein [Biomaibacter acetigenes]AYO29743.1 AroM protein [Biomaibacter acetigenes]
MKKLGLLTIGQAPRVDLVPEIKTVLGEDVEIIERGALDGLTLKEVEALYPGQDDEVLVTRMADDTEVKVAEREIFPRLKNQIKKLELEGINTIFLACTGEFPPFDSASLIVRPQKVLHHVVSSVAEGLTLGVIIPDERQAVSAIKRWSTAAAKVIVEPGSPYKGIGNVEKAAKLLANSGVDIVVMDCMGYTLRMKDVVLRHVKKPVILARSIAAKVVSELL